MMASDKASPLSPVLLVHNEEAQARMDDLRLPWGVQYELARGVGNGWWTWDQVVRADLNRLKGPNNNAAARVAQVILGHSLGLTSAADVSVWYVSSVLRDH